MDDDAYGTIEIVGHQGNLDAKEAVSHEVGGQQIL